MLPAPVVLGAIPSPLEDTSARMPFHDHRRGVAADRVVSRPPRPESLVSTAETPCQAGTPPQIPPEAGRSSAVLGVVSQQPETGGGLTPYAKEVLLHDGDAFTLELVHPPCAFGVSQTSLAFLSRRR